MSYINDLLKGNIQAYQGLHTCLNSTEPALYLCAKMFHPDYLFKFVDVCFKGLLVAVQLGALIDIGLCIVKIIELKTQPAGGQE